MSQIATERGRCTWPRRVTSPPSFPPPPLLRPPALIPPEISPLSTLFIFIICENAIFFPVPAFLLVNMQSLSKMDLAARPWLGPGCHWIFGEKYKICRMPPHYMLTNFFSLQGDIWKVVVIPGLLLRALFGIDWHWHPHYLGSHYCSHLLSRTYHHIPRVRTLIPLYPYFPLYLQNHTCG